jgi:hypothetical protein
MLRGIIRREVSSLSARRAQASNMKAVVVDHYIKEVKEAKSLVKDFPDPKPGSTQTTYARLQLIP